MAGNWKLKLETLDAWMRSLTKGKRGLERDRSNEPQQTYTKFSKPNRGNHGKRNG